MRVPVEAIRVALVEQRIWEVVKIMVPFWCTLNIKCRIIIGIQKGTIILTTTHMSASGFWVWSLELWGLRVESCSNGRFAAWGFKAFGLQDEGFWLRFWAAHMQPYM